MFGFETGESWDAQERRYWKRGNGERPHSQAESEMDARVLRWRTASTGSRRSLRGLGLPADFTPEQLKGAYRLAVKQHHPDQGGDPEQFRKITDAYNVLRSGKA